MRVTTQAYRHRVPLGLLMLKHGWITAEQLRRAVDAQRTAARGRIGEWLMLEGGVSEHLVTRALGFQWSCPVLQLGVHVPEALTSILPRLFLDAFRVLPLRVAAGQLVYLGFEGGVDPGLAFALERMSGLRVETGMLRSSEFRPAHRRMLDAPFPSVELLEAASEGALVRALTKSVERVQPLESRLVRLHDWLWLRLWRAQPTGVFAKTSVIHDIICTTKL